MAGSAGLIELVRAAALSAGTTILEIYAQPFAVQQKADASPVTLADQLAEAAIVEALRRASPDSRRCRRWRGPAATRCSCG